MNTYGWGFGLTVGSSVCVCFKVQFHLLSILSTKFSHNCPQDCQTGMVRLFYCAVLLCSCSSKVAQLFNESNLTSSAFILWVILLHVCSSVTVCASQGISSLIISLIKILRAPPSLKLTEILRCSPSGGGSGGWGGVVGDRRISLYSFFILSLVFRNPEFAFLYMAAASLLSVSKLWL